MVTNGINGALSLEVRGDVAEFRLVQGSLISHQAPSFDRAQLQHLRDSIDAAIDQLPLTPRQVLVQELYRRLSEDSRRIRFQTRIDLAWECARRKVKKIGRPVPERENRDWECKDYTSPGATSRQIESPLDDHFFVAVDWTGHWNVWGRTKEGEYWSYSGDVRKAVAEKEYRRRIDARQAEIAKEIGLEIQGHTL